MMKQLLAAAIAASVYVPEASGQSLIQRSDWQQRAIETYLPRVKATVPWLEMDPKTKLPKGDIPLGRHGDSFRPLVLPPTSAGIQVSTFSTFRSM